MRKMNLIAAAGLALLAGAAQAQVTLYGNLDVSVAYSKTKGANDSESTTAVESSHLVDSYIGFKGNEDLGGGLKALFTLESAIEC
ncbi:MAG: porin [Aquabacterium sp.]